MRKIRFTQHAIERVEERFDDFNNAIDVIAALIVDAEEHRRFSRKPPVWSSASRYRGRHKMRFVKSRWFYVVVRETNEKIVVITVITREKKVSLLPAASLA